MFSKYDENYGLDSRLYSKRYMKHKLCGIYNPHKVKYTDYMYNYPNSKPVISFKVNGISVECCSEWSVTDLNKEDIGKGIPIRYFYDKNGEIARVILEGKQYEKHRERGRKIMFWFFASIGIILIILAVLSVFVCYLTKYKNNNIIRIERWVKK